MSRRKGRYERRQIKRMGKKIQRSNEVGNLKDIFTFSNMYKAGKQCCKGVRWKNSVQRFEAHLFSGTAVRCKKVLEHKWKPAPYVQFTINERGKTRHIDAPRIQDRQIHKVFTKRVLLPLYKPYMIYNNGASQEGKGFQFSKELLKRDLRRHYKKYGRYGWIILIDFQKFFPSVSHEEIYKRHQRYLFSSDIRNVADDIVATARGDIGMPLGVEPSQAEMIAFPSDLDNYIKCQLSMKGAGHYMDDYYIIVPPDKDPKEILRLVVSKAECLKLKISPSKTKIIPLIKPFRFCKAKYTLTETGRVILNGNPKGVKYARRKIRAFPKKIAEGKMTYMDVWTSVNGTMAYFENYNDHTRVLRLRRLFYAIYGFSLENIENFKAKEEEINEVYCISQI